MLHGWRAGGQLFETLERGQANFGGHAVSPEKARSYLLDETLADASVGPSAEKLRLPRLPSPVGRGEEFVEGAPMDAWKDEAIGIRHRERHDVRIDQRQHFLHDPSFRFRCI